MEFKTITFSVACGECDFSESITKSWLCTSENGDKFDTWRHIQCEFCNCCADCHNIYKEIRDESIRLHKEYLKSHKEELENEEIEEVFCSEDHPWLHYEGYRDVYENMYYDGDIERWFNNPNFLEHLDDNIEPVRMGDDRVEYLSDLIRVMLSNPKLLSVFPYIILKSLNPMPND